MDGILNLQIMFGGLPPRFPSDSMSNEFPTTDVSQLPAIPGIEGDDETIDHVSPQPQLVTEGLDSRLESVQLSENPESELTPAQTLHEIVRKRQKANNDKVISLQNS